MVILGGGYDAEFCFDLITVNVKNMTVNNKDKQKIFYGRDIRNKGIKFQGEYFIMGGRQFKGEKYVILTNEWVQLKSYASLKNDNLDSWCSALTFDNQETNESPSHDF